VYCNIGAIWVLISLPLSLPLKQPREGLLKQYSTLSDGNFLTSQEWKTGLGNVEKSIKKIVTKMSGKSLCHGKEHILNLSSWSRGAA